MYIQRIGGRSVADTNIHPSLQLHAPLTVVPSSHLYLRGREQRKSIARLTPHPSASGCCQYLLASKVLVLTGDMARIPTASFQMAQSSPSCRRLYQTSRRHPRTYILTFFSNSSPCHTHLSIFSRLSTSSLTIAFTLELSNSTVTPTPTPPSDPLVALPTLRFFPSSLPPF